MERYKAPFGVGHSLGAVAALGNEVPGQSRRLLVWPQDPSSSWLPGCCGAGQCQAPFAKGPGLCQHTVCASNALWSTSEVAGARERLEAPHFSQGSNFASPDPGDSSLQGFGLAQK